MLIVIEQSARKVREVAASSSGRARPADSAAERALATLLERVRARAAQHAQWEAYLLAYNQRVSSELIPVRIRLATLQRALADSVAGFLHDPEQPGWLNAGQRATLRWLLHELEQAASQNPAGSEEDDHDGPRDQADNRRPGDGTRDAHGAGSGEEKAKSREGQEREEPQAGRADAHAGHDTGERHDSRSARQKAKKMAREQARRSLRAAEAGTTLRALYRKLALALHPDRERDSRLQAWKTSLLQRVNTAYRDRDLFTLLAIQFEASQHLSASPQIEDKTRAHYIDLLEERLAVLNAEIAECTAPFRAAIGCDAGYALTPAIVDRHLDGERERIESACAALEEDLLAFGTLAGLRSWLRRHTRVDTPAAAHDSRRSPKRPAESRWPEHPDRRPRRGRRK